MTVTILLLAIAAATTTQQDLPQLEVRVSTEPKEIFIKGSSATPQTASVKLTLLGRGARLPVDAILVIDKSVDLAAAKKFGLDFIDLLSAERDRIGLVAFAAEAQLMTSLTSDKEAVKGGLNGLESGAGSALGAGMKLANDELIKEGRAHAVRVQIILTSGKTIEELGAALTEAQRAEDAGIIIFTIGVGSDLGYPLLREIARITGGKFFKAPTDQALADIFKEIFRDLVGTDLKITQTLPNFINLEETAAPKPTTTKNPDGTMTLEWKITKLSVGESWTASFLISSSKQGKIQVTQAPSSVTFTDYRGSKTTKDIAPQSIQVKAPPIANFSFSPEKPTNYDEVCFKDESTDPDGTIKSWLWDFGDGNKSELQSPCHRYAEPGTFTVSLTVTDNDKIVATVAKPLNILKAATASRRFTAFIAPNKVLRGETFQVTVEIKVNKELMGMGLDEELPQGWEIRPLESAGAVPKKAEAQWSFLEAVQPGQIKTVIYEAKIPQGEQTGTFAITGTLFSASPDFKTQVEGEGAVEVLESLPIKVAVACFNTEKEVLDPTLCHRISFDQIQQVVAWWLSGTPIPGTAGQIIDFQILQELIAYWLTDTPVDKPLP